MHECAILLHNVRSAHNVGAIMRSAECAGVRNVYLTGYTPRPIDRFGRCDNTIAKTALGAETVLQWVYRVDPIRLIRSLRSQDWHIVGVEQDERAVDYRTFTPPEKSLLVLGNEVHGLSPSLRAQCDVLIEIPQYGKKESLNVSVAAGVVLFRYVQ